ncbi:hypothetical protein RHMOL_Rhmol02G0270000 [Rhododendron molle]|uniref:Uncharacterized protein n=1 Tax=Rhododendron molle TaxID=49168 RepID=A0ACC0PUQ1_RHOML|nr:hypothetical protein RHMOL_Rhmol02G0270000 [Rhododendron molle]
MHTVLTIEKKTNSPNKGKAVVDWACEDETGVRGSDSAKLGIELVVAEVAATLVVLLKLGKVIAAVDEATVVEAVVEDEELRANTGTGATEAAVVIVVGAEDEVTVAVGVEALVVVVMVENRVDEEVPKPMEEKFDEPVDEDETAVVVVEEEIAEVAGKVKGEDEVELEEDDPNKLGKEGAVEDPNNGEEDKVALDVPASNKLEEASGEAAVVPVEADPNKFGPVEAELFATEDPNKLAAGVKTGPEVVDPKSVVVLVVERGVGVEDPNKFVVVIEDPKPVETEPGAPIPKGFGVIVDPKAAVLGVEKGVEVEVLVPNKFDVVEDPNNDTPVLETELGVVDPNNFGAVENVPEFPNGDEAVPVPNKGAEEAAEELNPNEAGAGAEAGGLDGPKPEEGAAAVATDEGGVVVPKREGAGEEEVGFGEGLREKEKEGAGFCEEEEKPKGEGEENVVKENGEEEDDEEKPDIVEYGLISNANFVRATLEL